MSGCWPEEADDTPSKPNYGECAYRRLVRQNEKYRRRCHSTQSLTSVAFFAWMDLFLKILSLSASGPVHPIISITRPMTLNFQMRREDVLAFTREYHSSSPTYQSARKKVRLMLPAVMLCFWLFKLATDGFRWGSTLVFLGVAILWYFLYPSSFDHRVERYAQKTLDEGSHRKGLGPCELTLSESGLHSKSNYGESTFYWAAVDRVLLTDAYLFIFLNGATGYPIPITDVGSDAAKAAYEYAISHKTTAS